MFSSARGGGGGLDRDASSAPMGCPAPSPLRQPPTPFATTMSSADRGREGTRHARHHRRSFADRVMLAAPPVLCATSPSSSGRGWPGRSRVEGRGWGRGSPSSWSCANSRIGALAALDVVAAVPSRLGRNCSLWPSRLMLLTWADTECPRGHIFDKP
jgi:hypothetical protein